MAPHLIVIAGPTATGKSALAIALAQAMGGEIVNADSQQVYRGLDIGTGKPTAEQRAAVPHHLFDIAEPAEQLNAAQFASRADEIIADVLRRGRVPIVAGGTGLWIRALLKGLVTAPGRDETIRARLEVEARDAGLGVLYERLRSVDPESAERIHPSDPARIIRALEVFEVAGVPLSRFHAQDRQRPPRYEATQLALDLPREILNERIKHRARAMFEAGLIEEARTAAREPHARLRLERVMGYREALLHLEGKLSFDEAVSRTAIAQRQYARRQRTWFKAEPEWRWLDAREALRDIARNSREWGLPPMMGAWLSLTAGGVDDG